jgi:cobalt-zinc-cadmium efflux system protein
MPAETPDQHPDHHQGPNHGHAHSHAHAHDHSGAGHGHHHALGDGSEARLLWTLVLTAGFMLVEVAGGLWSGSLALIADAGHMLTDAAALGLAWYAVRASRRPADARRSFGHHRIQVLAAFINGLLLVGITVWIVVEALRRVIEPEPVVGGVMLGVAFAGLAVNLIAFLILGGADRNSLNVRGALLHVLGDLLGSVAAIVGALVILMTGWMPIDPILSVLVSALILCSAWGLLASSWHVLMEGVPPGLDIGALGRDLTAAVPGVAEVHHIHAWSLNPGRTLLTLHARIEAAADPDTVLAGLKRELARRYGIEHATIQIESVGYTCEHGALSKTC